MKITIKDAWEIEHQGIAHEMFDNYFAEMGIGIIKQAQPMYCNRSRNVLSTHKYVIAKLINPDGTRKDVGNQITVDGKTFRTLTTKCNDGAREGVSERSLLQVLEGVATW